MNTDTGGNATPTKAQCDEQRDSSFFSNGGAQCDEQYDAVSYRLSEAGDRALMLEDELQRIDPENERLAALNPLAFVP